MFPFSLKKNSVGAANMGFSFAQFKNSTTTFTCNAHAKRNHIRPTLMSVVFESRFWKHVRVSFAFNFVSKLLNARKVHHRVPLICFCLISCGKLLERIDHAGNRTERLCMYSNNLEKKKGTPLSFPRCLFVNSQCIKPEVPILFLSNKISGRSLARL